MKPIEPPDKLVPYSYDLGIYPISYGFILTEEALKVLKWRCEHVFIEPRSTNDDGSIKKWAVTLSARCLNKQTKKFEYESSPSNRDDTFLEECRFDSAEEALAFYKDVHIPLALSWKEKEGVLGYWSSDGTELIEVKFDEI